MYSTISLFLNYNRNQIRFSTRFLSVTDIDGYAIQYRHKESDFFCNFYIFAVCQTKMTALCECVK